MTLRDDQVAAISVLLSADRLAPLLAIAGSMRDAIELHQHMLRVGGTLMSLTATLEVALRNAACDQLRLHFGRPDWLHNPPAPFAWEESERSKIRMAIQSARRVEYAKLSQAAKRNLDQHAFPSGIPSPLSHEVRSKMRLAAITPQAGQVVAQLTLFFWKRLFSEDYEVSLWNTTLKRLFPDRAIRRAHIAGQLEVIYQTRNRLAHHEAVFGRRMAAALRAIDDVMLHFGRQDAQGETPLFALLKGERAVMEAQAEALARHIARFRVAMGP